MKVLSDIEENIKPERYLRLSSPPVDLLNIKNLLGMEPSLKVSCPVDSLQVHFCPSEGLPHGHQSL